MAMTVIIRLSDEQAMALEKKAAAEGLSVEQWIQKLAESDAQRPQGKGTGGDLIAALQASPYRDVEIEPKQLEQLRKKNFVELCEPVRGLAEDIDFSRNPSTARPLNL
jgi:hypothetical protein